MKGISEAEKIVTGNLQPELRALLTEATSERKIDEMYSSYINNPSWFLYEWEANAKHICCIGMVVEEDSAEIKQIATAAAYRKKGWGHRMIEFIKTSHQLKMITAETDRDAVFFYLREGFRAVSLGEKYPGVERFLCTWRLNDEGHVSLP